jgi:hypothetical protein
VLDYLDRWFVKAVAGALALDRWAVEAVATPLVENALPTFDRAVRRGGRFLASWRRGKRP